MDDVKAGVYRHYKGHHYLVLGLAHDANADTLYDEWTAKDALAGVPSGSDPLGERVVVVYIGLELDDAHTGPRLAVRTYDDFFAKVHNDGTACEHTVERYGSEGQTYICTYTGAPVRERFTYLGPTYERSEVGI